MAHATVSRRSTRARLGRSIAGGIQVKIAPVPRAGGVAGARKAHAPCVGDERSQEHVLVAREEWQFSTPAFVDGARHGIRFVAHMAGCEDREALPDRFMNLPH